MTPSAEILIQATGTGPALRAEAAVHRFRQRRRVRVGRAAVDA